MKTLNLTSLLFLATFCINAQSNVIDNNNKKVNNSIEKEKTHKVPDSNEVSLHNAIPLIGERSEVPLPTTVTIVIGDDERKPKEKNKSNPK